MRELIKEQQKLMPKDDEMEKMLQQTEHTKKQVQTLRQNADKLKYKIDSHEPKMINLAIAHHAMQEENAFLKDKWSIDGKKYKAMKK